ncbi:MAG TPA: alkaline phosphatase [Burkholderiales bacterium]|nr:alkaline phosphatase [Burkholderiales bacterium]
MGLTASAAPAHAFPRAQFAIAVAALFLGATAPALAGPDDDAPFKGDGVTTNAVQPIQGGRNLADFPTNAEPNSGLRLLPPTGTQLIAGQRFDLRVETQLPAKAAPELKRLTVNGRDITAQFNARIAKQGAGLESGTPASPLLYGATARNLSLDRAGVYTIEAVVAVDGVERSISNTYPVAASPFGAGGGKVKRVVFFLGDAMGLPVRTAARIVGRGVFEGRSAATHMDSMDEYGLVKTSSFDSIITDSAPGMATYVTGMKQANNALNVAVDNTPENGLDNPRIETLWEFLKRTRGWKTGVVTDAFATDATPAAVAAHSRARSARAAIAQQLLGFFRDDTQQKAAGFKGLAELTQPLDVILGGGARDWMLKSNPALKNFYQYGGANDGRSDVDLFADIAPSRGYATARNLAELNAAPDDKPLLGIFTGEFRTTASGLGGDNIPGVLDRRVARGLATIRGKDASAPEIGMSGAPPQGTGCGATIAECFRAVPSKVEMVKKAVSVLDRLAGGKSGGGKKDGGWILLVEQSQTDKLAHPLEYERVVYEALELDETLGWVTERMAKRSDALVVVTADHAQPETIIGVALPGAVKAGGATPPGGCFSGAQYPITLGAAGESNRPCALQDAIGTFNDATFPTYMSSRKDGYPDDPDPEVKLIMEDGGRPTYSTNFLTNYQPLEPSTSKSAALPNPQRAPDGLLMTGNMPTRNVAGSANKTENSVSIAPHSGDDVPLSASGAGAGLFGGVYENADVHVRIAAAIGGAKSRKDLRKGSEYTNVPAIKPPGTALKGL